MHKLLFGILGFLCLTSFPLPGASLGNPPDQVSLTKEGFIFILSNRFDTYYINETGIQLTNHKDEYWSHNIWAFNVTVGSTSRILYADSIPWTWENRTDESKSFYELNGTYRYVYSSNYHAWFRVKYYLDVQSRFINVSLGLQNTGNSLNNVDFGWLVRKIRISSQPKDDYGEIYRNVSGSPVPSRAFLNDSETYNFNEKSLYLRYYGIKDFETRQAIDFFWSDVGWKNNNSASIKYNLFVNNTFSEYNSQILLLLHGSSAATGDVLWTSFLWHDASKEYLYPNAAGDVTEIPTKVGGASNFQCVDDQPYNSSDNDSSYVSTSTSSSQFYTDLYNYDNTNLTGSTINYVTVWVRPRSESATDTGAFYSVTKTYGTMYNGSAYSPSTSYSLYGLQYANNPNTSSPWTVSELNSLQHGESARSGLGFSSALSWNFWAVNWTKNSLTAWALNVSSGTTTENRIWYSGTSGTGTWGIRVWKRTASGVESELTSGSPAALINKSTTGYATLSNTWKPANTTLLSTDSLVVRVYGKVGSSGWYQFGNWTTDQLGAEQLIDNTWTVYYNVEYGGITSNRYIRFRFGFYDFTGEGDYISYSYISGVKIKYSTKSPLRVTQNYIEVDYTPQSKTWQTIATWSFDLIIRQWKTISTFSLNLLTREWVTVGTYIFNILSRQWTTQAQAEFYIISRDWETLATRIFHIENFVTGPNPFEPIVPSNPPIIIPGGNLPKNIVPRFPYGFVILGIVAIGCCGLVVYEEEQNRKKRLKTLRKEISKKRVFD